MANIGLYIELKDGVFKKSNRELLSLAAKGGHKVHAVLFCPDVQPYMEELQGIQTVIQIKGTDLSYQPDRYARTLAAVIEEFQIDVFCGIYSAQGKDLFPRLAAKAKAGLVNDCLAVDLAGRKAVKPVYSGKLLAEYQVDGAKALFTVRPNVIAVGPIPAGDVPELKSVTMDSGELGTRIVDVIKSASKKIDLTEAEIIVSGGRAMKARENFAILEDLARVLHSGVGASRAAVDAGFASSDMQVGQSRQQGPGGAHFQESRLWNRRRPVHHRAAIEERTGENAALRPGAVSAAFTLLEHLFVIPPQLPVFALQLPDMPAQRPQFQQPLQHLPLDLFMGNLHLDQHNFNIII
jgi:electron transfer flavoprotein alpha subunit